MSTKTTKKTTIKITLLSVRKAVISFFGQVFLVALGKLRYGRSRIYVASFPEISLVPFFLELIKKISESDEHDHPNDAKNLLMGQALKQRDQYFLTLHGYSILTPIRFCVPTDPPFFVIRYATTPPATTPPAMAQTRQSLYH